MSVNDPVANYGGQISSQSMSNASLHTRLRASHESGNGLDLASVLDDLLSSAAQSLSADSGFVLVLDEGGWPSHWFVLTEGQSRFVSLVHARAIVERGLVGWVIQHQRGELVEDLTQDPRWLPLPHLSTRDDRGSALCVPLLVYRRVVGVLALIHQDSGFFEFRHLGLLQDMGDRTALSIENARLYETVRRRAEEMAALYELALNISADQPLDRLLDIVVAHMMDLLHCHGGGVFLWQEEETALRLVAAYDPELAIGDVRVTIGEGLVGCAFERGEPLTFDDYKNEHPCTSGTAKGGIPFGLPVTAAIAVPLVWQGQTLGVLIGIDRTPARHFDHRDQRMLTLMANQVAAAVASVQLRDQTSRRLQELDFLHKAQRELEGLRESLTHMMVHDLRGPVGIISNSLQLLSKLLSDAGSDQAIQLIGIASRSTQRLLNLVDSILDISRLEAGQALTTQRPISIEALIQSAVEQQALYVQRKRIRLSVQCPDGLPAVMADAGMIERVLVNLMSNAVKFTPTGGDVSILVESESDVLYVRVRDSGPGIAAEHQRQIFEKFARVHDQERMGGIGLGLAFCRLAIEAHGGRIWVESSLGQGSTFIFTLPLSGAQEGSPAHTRKSG